MNTSTLLKECKSRNIILRVVENQLHYRAPKGALNDCLKKQLKAYKPDLIKALSTELAADCHDNRVRAAISEFNSRGIKYTDVPKAKRSEADKFDREMTEAANRNDKKAFIKALTEWKRCFH